MTEMQRIAVCILQHLRQELSNPAISDESKESLEVAIQCLESVYEIGPDDMAALSLKETLPNLLREAVGNEKTSFKPAQAKAPGAPKKEPNPEAESAKQRGNELLKAEKYLEALEMYSKAIDLDPENAVYFCNRAAAFSKLDKSQEALADCEAALNIDPGYSKAYGRMGIAYAASGDHQKALDCYLKALELDPTNESYQNNVRVAREQLRGMSSGGSGGGNPAAGLAAGIAGIPDITQLLGNPALVNMATQMMQDPGMQTIMTNIVSGTLNTGQQTAAPPQQQPAQQQQQQEPTAQQQQDPAGQQQQQQQQNQQRPAFNGLNPNGFSVDEFLLAGQQFAQAMRNSHGPLIDQLRREMDSRGFNPQSRNNDSEGRPS